MPHFAGSEKAIYLHWDGYPGHAGAVLGGWYKTPEQVTALLDLGDLSEIEIDLEKCVAYHRDRHEPYRTPSTYADKLEYQYKGKGDFGADYMYLYEDGEWSVFGIYHEPDWVRLEIQIGKECEK
ncbi:MAG: hypothetical protein MJ033_03215 [Victivallaceae bacterium]|nr:hypothetical protein [Victivallaceae bacterium]